MPLSAEIDGVNVIATFIPIDEWLSLQKEVKARKKSVVMPCCGARGILKKNHHETKYFAHYKGTLGDCPQRGETPEHMQAKEKILLACRDSGFNAQPEYRNGKWRADVFAEKDGLQIAFEVQLSRQTMEVTLERQVLYSNDKVIGCWFFTNIPHTPNFLKDKLQNLQISICGLIKCRKTGFYVVSEDRRHSLYNFVKDYLLNIEIESKALSCLNEPVDLVHETYEEPIPEDNYYSSRTESTESFAYLLEPLSYTISAILFFIFLCSPWKLKWKWGLGLLLAASPLIVKWLTNESGVDNYEYYF